MGSTEYHLHWPVSNERRRSNAALILWNLTTLELTLKYMKIIYIIIIHMYIFSGLELVIALIIKGGLQFRGYRIPA
jgi:hypothetical protein